MKKILSIALLLTLVFSLAVLPSTAAENEKKNVLSLDTAEVYLEFGMSSSGVNHIPENVFDGINKYNPDDGSTFCDSRLVDGLQPYLDGTAQKFDIMGNSDVKDTPYYTGMQFKLDKVYTVDSFTLYSDNAIEGVPSSGNIDGFDILVSKTGEEGSWTVVYSGKDLLCTKQYQIATDAETGLQTTYITADFAAVEAQYIAFALTASRCQHADALMAAYGLECAGRPDYWRLCELEVYEASGNAPVTVNGRKNIMTIQDETYLLVDTLPGGWNHKPARIFDGVIDHNGDNADSFCNHVIQGGAESYINGTSKHYDIDGIEDENSKYYHVYQFEFEQMHTVDGFKLYTDSGKTESLFFNIDGFDILLSETAEPGSWKTVYSGSDLLCTQQYKIHENGDFKTSYIEADFDATNAKFVAIGITASRCQHADALAKLGMEVNGRPDYFSLTEFELYEAPATVNTRKNIMTIQDETYLLVDTLPGGWNHKPARIFDGVIDHNGDNADSFCNHVIQGGAEKSDRSHVVL